MNLDSLTIALSQISYLVTTLSKRNYSTYVQELAELISCHGLEADRHLLYCLLSEIDFNCDITRTPNSKDYQQVQLLSQECSILFGKPALVSVLCFAVGRVLQQKNLVKNPSQLLIVFSKIVKLSPVQEVVFGLTLLHSSNSEISESASKFINQKLPTLIHDYIEDNRKGGLYEAAPQVLHFILAYLVRSKDFFGISPKTEELFLHDLRKDFPRELVPVVLSPLLYPDLNFDLQVKMAEESVALKTNLFDDSVPNLIMEMGYGFCSTFEKGRQNMNSLNIKDLNSSVIARILIMMIRTHAKLDDLAYWTSTDSCKEEVNENSSSNNTWNVEVFVKLIGEYSPNIQWINIIHELDCEEFQVRDRQGLILLITTLKLGLQTQGYLPDKFPVDLFYKHWKHSEAQFSLINQILQNSDVFCFADYSFHTVVTNMLKINLEHDNKDIRTWLSLDLMDLLMHFADKGLMNQVQELFKYPIQYCPEILFLSVLQVKQPWTIFRQELFSSLVPIFLSNHIHSNKILSHVWETQSVIIKQLFMQSMADWYIHSNGDHTRLSRILDIAQELKILSSLLNSTSFQFTIDLACLASRREYLKLGKWVFDKIRDLGEVFITALIKFLQRRSNQFTSSSLIKDESHLKMNALPSETFSTLLQCLQACAGNVTPEVAEAILNLIKNSNMSLNNKILPMHSDTLRSRGIDSNLVIAKGYSSAVNTQIDKMSGINFSFKNLELNAAQTSTFNLPGPFGSLVPSSNSTSILSQNASSLFQQITSPSISQINHGVANSLIGVNSVNRVISLSNPIDKSKFGENNLISNCGDLNYEVAKDIEEEANSYFQRIYNYPPHTTLTTDELLELLKKFQESSNKREKEIYNCMIRNLFEEYKFFPQYPNKELHITAQLFGGILANGLVPQGSLFAVGIRFIVDALRKPSNSKIFMFGVAALLQFKHKLKEVPKLCEYVINLSNFSEFPPNLIELVEYGAQGLDPPEKIQTVTSKSVSVLHSSPAGPNIIKTAGITTSPLIISPSTQINTPTRPSIANATNIDTLLVATERNDKIVIPSENLQDKIAFIFNNISQLNLSTKCQELKDIIKEEYFYWLAQYLVVKRASLEQNFHVLYANLLDCFNSKEFNALILNETYRNIKVLLRSDKSVANFSDRTLLKNLGHWLGMITLAKNKPVLMSDLDLKILLLEAYQKGQHELLFVIPFIAKILESCAKSRVSKVFKPPNPWTISIIFILNEIHQEQDLKLNLKFEIEVLCKNLQIDIKSLRLTNYLRDIVMLTYIEPQLSNTNNQYQVMPICSSLPSFQNSISQVSSSLIPVTTTVFTSLVSIPSVASSFNNNSITSVPDDILPQQLNNMGFPFMSNSLHLPQIVSNNVTPEPKFNFLSFIVANISALGSLIHTNSQAQLFQIHPQLKQFIRPAFETAVQEWLGPTVERSVKIAVNTTEQIVKKDFALDTDECRVRAAAHYMIRNLTAGMAMITCRESLVSSFTFNLRKMFLNVITNPTPQQKEMIEAAVESCANDNMDLACAFIQKTSIDKAISEIDRHLFSEYERRKNARNEGRRYYDAGVLAYQIERMPELVRLQVNGVTTQQMAVYEEFTRNIPGFQSLNDKEISICNSKTTSIQFDGTVDEIGAIYDKLINELEMYLQTMVNQNMIETTFPNNQMNISLSSFIEALTIHRRNRNTSTAITVIQKAVEGLLDCITQDDVELSLRYREYYLRTLKIFQDSKSMGVQWANKLITKCLIESREEYRYNIEAVDLLIRSRMLNLQMLDAHVAQAMDNGLNFVAVNFGMHLVQYYLIEEKNRSLITEQDLSSVIEMLVRITAHSRNLPDGLLALMELLRINHDSSGFFTERTPVDAVAYIHSGILQVKARDCDDPPGLYEKTEYLLREWINIYQTSSTNKDPNKAFSLFVHQMNIHGILKTDDLITRFFRLSTQMIVELCYRLISDQVTHKNSRFKIYQTIDAYVKLIALLVKHSGDLNNIITKLNLLNKVLGIVAGVLLQDHDSHKIKFHQLPYHRIFIMLFIELNSFDQVLENINFHILQAFSHTLHILRPCKCPGFCFAWLEIISHRTFLGRLLAFTPNQKGWSMYAQLLIDLFKFIAPFLRNTNLIKAVSTLYRGALKVLLVLLHDFPEFLCDYHYGFCDVIPPNCIQMRNLILSAFPRNMRLPDPFTPNLKVDMLAEISQAPRILPAYAASIQPVSFRKSLDTYLRTRIPATFLTDMIKNFQTSSEVGVKYNIPLINAVSLYVGVNAISSMRNKGQSPNMSTIAYSAHMDIFQHLCSELDTEGRYLFLNAITNQLRYPNSHTHYFSCLLLYLFSEANSERIQEQITRVLLERIIVNRPHPWGLLITFIELIKNPIYRFWSHEFVHCAVEIEKLFESVARSCMVPTHLIHGSVPTDSD